jgi:hypothetical protein
MPKDVARIASLCAEHARFDSGSTAGDLESKLHEALFCRQPVVRNHSIRRPQGLTAAFGV